MTDKNKLELISQIANKAWEFPGGDSVSWAGFLEGTINAVEVIANYEEGEHESDTSV